MKARSALAALLILSLALLPAAGEGKEKANPFGVQGTKGGNTAQPHKKPGPAFPWNVSIVSDDVRISPSAASDTPLKLPAEARPRFGDVYNVVKEQKFPPRRYLLARFV